MMNTVVYVALVSRAVGGGYEAHFPDVPECAAEGATVAELLINARQRLLARLEAIEAGGDAWPEATPLETLAAEPGVMAIPVDVAVDDPPVRVNISLGERLVQRLDAAAQARGMTRSGFIAQSVRSTLGETARGPGEFDAMGRRVQDELWAMAKRINDSIGPDSSFTRRMNEFDDALYDGVRKAVDSVSAAMTRRRDAAKTWEKSNGEAPPTGL